MRLWRFIPPKDLARFVFSRLTRHPFPACPQEFPLGKGPRKSLETCWRCTVSSCPFALRVFTRPSLQYGAHTGHADVMMEMFRYFDTMQMLGSIKEKAKEPFSSAKPCLFFSSSLFLSLFLSLQNCLQQGGEDFLREVPQDHLVASLGGFQYSMDLT